MVVKASGPATIRRMSASPQSPLTAEGILAQLRVEIARKGTNVKSLSVAMGVPYDSFRDYVNGERRLPVDTLLRALDSLSVPLSRFADEAARNQTTPEEE